MDDELEKFKTKIDITGLAISYGFEIDEKESCPTSLVMRHTDGSKIIAATGADRHGIFFDVRGNASGSVIDFVMWRQGVNLGHARKVLREYSGQQSFSFATVRVAKPEPITRDRAGLVAKWHGFQLYRPGYLEGRGLTPATIMNFADHLRTDQRGNVIFRHDDENGLSGWEIKNRGFTGFAGGGKKGLFCCRIVEYPETLPSVVVVAESAIDAMSYYQLHPDSGLYISFAGGLSAEQIRLLRETLHRYPQVVVLDASDKDAKGEEYSNIVRAIRPDAVRAEPLIGKDWNDTLNHRASKFMSR